MIDFHSHILPNIDDGAKSVEETFNLIKEANKAGFTGIISTSHYFEGRYEIEEKERKTWVDAISNNLKNQALDTKLYLGSEIFITNNIVNLIEEKNIYYK